MKRWWVLALVFTLALSLTSCSSKKKNLQSGYGFGYCDGTIGSFDVYVINSGKGTYDLSLIPVQVNAGDLVVVTILNQGLMLKTMITQATIQNDQELFAGTMTESDVANFDMIAITPWDPNQANLTVLEQNHQTDALCALPLPEGANGLGGSIN